MRRCGATAWSGTDGRLRGIAAGRNEPDGTGLRSIRFGAQGSPGHRGRRPRRRRCHRRDSSASPAPERSATALDLLDVVKDSGCGVLVDAGDRAHLPARYGPPHRSRGPGPHQRARPGSPVGPCRQTPGGDGRRFPDRECQIDHLERRPSACRPSNDVAHSGRALWRGHGYPTAGSTRSSACPASHSDRPGSLAPRPLAFAIQRGPGPADRCPGPSGVGSGQRNRGAGRAEGLPAIDPGAGGPSTRRR